MRAYSLTDKVRLFIRDGFVDRYSGDRLLFPGVLRLRSGMNPVAVPWHPNWKAGATHSSYWHEYASTDHLVPVARGGTDDSANLVTCSMIRNLEKSDRLISELGWTLHPAGDGSWDGGLGLFMATVEADPKLLDLPHVRAWHAAAIAARAMPAVHDEKKPAG